MAWPSGFIVGNALEYLGQFLVTAIDDDSITIIGVPLELLEAAYEAATQRLKDDAAFQTWIIINKGLVYACADITDWVVEDIESLANQYLSYVNFFLVG